MTHLTPSIATRLHAKIHTALLAANQTGRAMAITTGRRVVAVALPCGALGIGVRANVAERALIEADCYMARDAYRALTAIPVQPTA